MKIGPSKPLLSPEPLLSAKIRLNISAGMCGGLF